MGVEMDHEQEINPASIREQLVAHGEAWADANCAADLMEEVKKTLLASLIKEEIAKDGCAYNRAEVSAMASAKYQNHLTDMVEARRLANRARVQYDADKAFIDLLRSKESTTRALINLR